MVYEKGYHEKILQIVKTINDPQSTKMLSIAVSAELGFCLLVNLGMCELY